MSNATLAIQIIEITTAIPELDYDGTEHSTATAELVAINDERIEDGEVVSYDAIEIVHAGETDTIEVESNEDRGAYDVAVREFLGAGVAFTWLPGGF